MAHVHDGNGVLTDELVGEEGEHVPQRVRRRSSGFDSGKAMPRRLGRNGEGLGGAMCARRREGSGAGRKKEPPPLPFL